MKAVFFLKSQFAVFEKIALLVLVSLVQALFVMQKQTSNQQAK